MDDLGRRGGIVNAVPRRPGQETPGEDWRPARGLAPAPGHAAGMPSCTPGQPGHEREREPERLRTFLQAEQSKNGLRDVSGHVAEGATSVETSSLTERQTTGVPPWQRLSAVPGVPHAIPGDSRARGVHHGPFGLIVFSLRPSPGPSADSRPIRMGGQEPPQFGRGRGNRRGMRERVTEQTGQQRPCRLNKTSMIRAGARTGQRAKRAGKPPVGVGITPRVRMSEQGGDCLMHVVVIRGCRPPQRSRTAGRPRAELTGRRVSAQARSGTGRASRRADGRQHRGEDLELQVEAGQAENCSRGRRGGSQAQNTAKQPGAATDANQHGKPARIAEGHLGQIDDDPAGTRAQHAQELLTQPGNARDIQLAADRHDDPPVLTADRKRKATKRTINFVRHHVQPPISVPRQNQVVARLRRR